VSYYYYEGPLKPSDPGYKGSNFNIIKDGKMGRLPLSPYQSMPQMILLTAPSMPERIMCLTLMVGSGLRALQGDKKLYQMVNQAKL